MLAEFKGYTVAKHDQARFPHRARFTLCVVALFTRCFVPSLLCALLIASMFGIPELDDMVCKLLERRDLINCVRVSKKWNSSVIPHLWKDLSWLDHASKAQLQAFKRLLLEDYLYVQQAAASQEERNGTEQPTPTPSSFSSLSNYIPWIQVLPDPRFCLPLSDNIQPGLPLTGNLRRPRGKEPLLHFVTRCRSARISHYCLAFDHYDLDRLDHAIVTSILPRVRHLTVEASYDASIGGFRALQHLLDQCSTTLEKLTLEIEYQPRIDAYQRMLKARMLKDETEDPDTTEPEEWSFLKELVLRPRNCTDALQPTNFWSWVYKRCGRAENLEVSKVKDPQGLEVSITDAALVHMPNLINVTLGCARPIGRNFPLRDNEVATFLGGTRKGWKAVRLKCNTRFQDQSLEALEKHFATLEVFEVGVSDTQHGPASEHLLQVLRSCPNLHTFMDNDQDFYLKNMRQRLIQSVFIDRDATTGLLRDWACESSLRVLKITITNIPRPDMVHERGTANVYEAYRDQGREIQGHVYDRIARLVNLETLWLGHKCQSGPEALGYTEDQRNCMEMSLESGLHKLSELKKLKELSVSGMKTRIGPQEVQWMVEHWPRLKTIYGLYFSSDDGRAAAAWLRENCPRIKDSQL